MYKSTFIYDYVCTEYMTTGMCLCELMAAIGMFCYWFTICCLWCASMYILYNYRHICAPVKCTIIPLHPLSYNIV